MGQEGREPPGDPCSHMTTHPILSGLKATSTVVLTIVP